MSSAPTHLAGGKPADDQDFILERRRRLVARYLHADDTLLDFGCGIGAQAATFAGAVRRIVGIDVDPAYLRGFLPRVRRANATVSALAVRYDGFSLPLRSSCVDAVVSFEVLEHVADERRALEEIHRVLKPGGICCITVPNRWWVFETHGADLPLLRWNRVPLFGWLPKSLHDRWARARNYRRREIVAMLAAHGFEVQESHYVTAPMDVVRSTRLQALLRSTLFRADTTRVPILATAVLAIARRP